MATPMFRSDGFGSLDSDLHRIRVNTTQAKPAFRAIAEVFAAAQRHQFDSEGQHYGPPWAELDPAYARQKAQKYPGTDILEANGRLRDAAAPNQAEDFGVYRVTNDEVEVGIDTSDVPYAGYVHADRPIIGEPTPGDREDVMDIIQRHLTRGTRHARR